MTCQSWEGSTIDGKFPLLEWLGGWADRCIFLTVRQGTQRSNIKLIPASGADADAHLAYWETARSLSHPHLLQLMESGRCTVQGTDVVYVLTEKTDAILSSMIPLKPLDRSEVKPILDPVVDALSFLHEKGFGHGSLRPSNIVQVGTQWKLTSEKIASGEFAGRKSDEYDAPEVAAGELTPASDIWSLGMIVVEVFKQRTPIWNNDAKQDPVIPDSLPPPYFEIARGCLHWDPAKRISVSDVRALLTQDTFPIAIPAAVDNKSPGALPAELSSIPPPPAAVAPSTEPIFPETNRGEPAVETADLFPEMEPVEFAPRSRMFANLEEESERTGGRGFTFLVVLALLVAAAVIGVRGYRNHWFNLGGTQNTPAQSQSPPLQPAQNEAAQAPAQPANTAPRSPATQLQPESSSSQTEAQSSQAPVQPSQEGSASQPPLAQTAPPATEVAPESAKPSRSHETRRQPQSTLEEQAQSSEGRAPRANGKGAVVSRVLPNISPGASSSMRAPVEVELRVSVNERGKVSNVQYMTKGQGNYFARTARQAALSWTFRPPESEGQAMPSEWILLFRFERRRTEATAAPVH